MQFPWGALGHTARNGSDLLTVAHPRQACFNSRMIELALLGVIAFAATRYIHRKRQKDTGSAAPGVVRFSCMLKVTARTPQWLRGHLFINSASQELSWHPSPNRQDGFSLPPGLKKSGVRRPSMREAMRISPLARIVEFRSDEGDVPLAVLPDDLESLTRILSSN